jgi:hypothetical protein
MTVSERIDMVVSEQGCPLVLSLSTGKVRPLDRGPYGPILAQSGRNLVRLIWVGDLVDALTRHLQDVEIQFHAPL